MTLEAVHVAAACVTASALAITLAMWLTSESRRSTAEARLLAAEQRVDDIRAQTIALLVRADRLLTMTDDHLNAWDMETPQAYTLGPERDRIRLAHSAAWAAMNLTRGGIAAFQEGIDHGRSS